jgi:hypothetical protein
MQIASAPISHLTPRARAAAHVAPQRSLEPMQGSCELYTHLGKSEEEERGGDTLPKQPSRVHSKSSSKHQSYGPHSIDKFSRPVET